MSLVNHFHRLGNEKDYMMNDTSGPRLGEPFAIYDHDTCSWRTCSDTSLWGSIPFLGKFPKRGIMLAGHSYELPTSERPTVVNASSSWRGLPTPRASDHNATMNAPGAIRHVEKNNGNLVEVVGVKLLPTPTASDWCRTDNKGDANRKSPAITTISTYFPHIIGENTKPPSDNGNK